MSRPCITNESDSNLDTSVFLTRIEADNRFHNEDQDINMNNHKITNLKDGTENSDAIIFINYKEKLI